MSVRFVIFIDLYKWQTHDDYREVAKPGVNFCGACLRACGNNCLVISNSNGNKNTTSTQTDDRRMAGTSTHSHNTIAAKTKNKATSNHDNYISVTTTSNNIDNPFSRSSWNGDPHST